MYNIEAIREQFPILERMVDKKRKLVYLDSGATAQKPQCVIDTISNIYSMHNANVHRGVHRLSAESTAMYEAARERIRNFIGANSTREIIFTSGATASINTVAMSWGMANITSADEILVSEMEHHSNIVPWQLLCERTGATLKVLPFDDNGDLRYDLLDRLLTPRTKLVAVMHTSNVLGTVNDLSTIITKAHSVGAKVMVDGCQGVVHSSINVVDLDCDFFAFSGHKLYAPTGIGILYGKEELLESMPPFMGGGDMISTVSFEKTTYAELPLKFEAGTTNYVGAIALARAIEFVEEIGMEAIVAHEHQILEYATAKLSAIDGLKIYGQSKSKCGIVSFEIDGIHSLDLGMILDKLGVAIRTGTHCAEPVMQHYGIKSMARASFGLYSTHQDIDALVAGVNQAINMLR